MKVWKSYEVTDKRWPRSADCKGCGKAIKLGDVALAHSNTRDGTIAFHKECIVDIVEREWPETRYEKIKKKILADGWGAYKPTGV